MSMGLVRGLLTLVLFSSFIGLWIWAWSHRRKGDFEAAAALPLNDDSPADRQLSTVNSQLPSQP